MSHLIYRIKLLKNTKKLKIFEIKYINNYNNYYNINNNKIYYDENLYKSIKNKFYNNYKNSNNYDKIINTYLLNNICKENIIINNNNLITKTNISIINRDVLRYYIEIIS